MVNFVQIHSGTERILVVTNAPNLPEDRCAASYKLPEANTMANGKDVTRTRIGVSEGAGDVSSPKQAEEVLLKAGALQKAIFNSANFSSIATDAKGVMPTAK